MKGTAWKRLRRGDLAAFDKDATDAILTTMSLGGVGRVSARGHATIRNDDGRTLCIGRDSSAPHTVQNIHADIRRLFPATDPSTEEDKSMAQVQNSAPIFTDLALIKPTPGTPEVPQPVLRPCPAKGCEAEFETSEAMDSHVDANHKRCKWPGCDLGVDGQAFVGASTASIAGHTNIRHKGARPWEAAQKAAREAAASKRAAKQSAPVPAAIATPAELAKSKEEHRGLPSAPVEHKPQSAAAKLAAIREILGPDPQVAILKKKLEELEAHLELVREAVGLDKPKNK